MELKVLAICVLLAVAECSMGLVNPGLHSRVTKKGLNYAAQVAIDLLSAKVKSQHIPDVSGSSHHLEYTLSNIKITQFTKPQSSVIPLQRKGLSWAARNLGLSLHADFRYKYKKIIKISDHGSIDVSISGAMFTLAMGMGADSGGRPTIRATGCNSDTGHLSIKFHGGRSWLYNLLEGLFKGKISSQVRTIVCSSAQSAINDNAGKALRKLPVTVTIAHKFLLDYRLTNPPTFTSAYMETLHKGEVFWSTAVTEAPFSAPALPAFVNSSRMLYFQASDYLVNTMAYVAHQHDVLKKNVTDKDLPADKRSFLNTTCHGFSLCLGTLIPEAGRKYPGSKAELHMASDRPPKMSISASEIGVNFGGNIAFWARTASKAQFFMFSVKVVLNTTLRASVKSEMVLGEIDDMHLGVEMDKSQIGPVNAEILQRLLNGAIALYVKPQLNALGAKGFPLPVTGQVKFTNTQLSLMKDAIVLGTDLTYSSKQQTHEPDRHFQVISGNNLKNIQHLK